LKLRFDSQHESHILFFTDEEDQFGSDFASTDEEEAKEDPGAQQEKEVEEEDKTTRMVSNCLCRCHALHLS
jgi:hypothetical protein